jgi:hypothetical protein
MTGSTFNPSRDPLPTRAQQVGRIVELLAYTEHHGAPGLTADELRIRLYWPTDSVAYWVQVALDHGEIAVAPGESDLPAAERHYVTVGAWRNAADGNLGL